ncbi:NAD(P)H-binding protein [Halopseudomonas maritima]|uniref:NAD(P)H-binding protein n=1 Tax=Halopseudomonas maritima TaxID=2918528 RepID=UPI001EEAA590|nr:NAD(P)H-binding protein [Halopseudomonas maritima]UJJ32969.1 NAD(P)H-binding protein [Halopseudomonas maritima]
MHNSDTGKTLLVLGGSGLVGLEVLRQALADPQISRVVAPTRRPLPAAVNHYAHLDNPQIDFDSLPEDADWWHCDAVICALGTTRKRAGSREAFRAVDRGYVSNCARLARRAGTRTFVLNSSLGASPRSGSFYLRVKGEVEQELGAMGFPSLSLVRPSLLDGDRSENRPGELVGLLVSRAFKPVMPKRLQAVKASDVAATLLQAAITALTGRHVIESNAIVRHR